MDNFKTMTVGEIVAEDFGNARVFDRYKIDFCCNGSIPLAEACKLAGADIDKVIGELKHKPVEDSGVADFKGWPTDLLVDYILKWHHRNIRRRGPEIRALLDKVCNAHGGRHPELYEVQRLFDESLPDLENHLQKEEVVLFPYVYELYDAKTNGTPVPEFHCGTIKSPIAVMMAEHDAEGERYRHISYLTNGYATPDDGCASYHLLMEKLKAFEIALHEHIHLENNIVFPRAIETEEILKH